MPLVSSCSCGESELKRLTCDPRFADLSGRFYEALILRRGADAAGRRD